MHIALPTVIVARAGGLATRPGACVRIVGRGRNLRTWESSNACGAVDVWVARRCRTAGGTRGAVASTRRGGAGVRTAGGGVRRAVGAGRHAAGAGRPVGTRASASGAGRGGGPGPAPARGGDGRGAV